MAGTFNQYWLGGTTNFQTAANWSNGTFLGKITGTAQAGGASTITLAAGDGAANGQYVGFWIYLTGGTGAGQWGYITGYVSSTKVATVLTAWSVNPDNTTTYTIGDNATLTGSSVNIDSGLSNATSGLFISAFNYDLSYTGLVGNASASGTISTYLTAGAVVYNLGLPSPTGSGNGPRRFNLDTGTTSGVQTLNVLNTPNTGADTGFPPVRVIGTIPTVNAKNGACGFAVLPTEVCTITTLNVTDGGGGNAPSAYLGNGVTLTTLNQNSGRVTAAALRAIPNATLNNTRTVLLHIGQGGYGNLTVNGSASVVYDGLGTVTNLVLRGTIDLSGGGGAVVFGNTTCYSGYKFIDPDRRAVFTNAPVFSGCSIGDGGWQRGPGSFP